MPALLYVADFFFFFDADMFHAADFRRLRAALMPVPLRYLLTLLITLRHTAPDLLIDVMAMPFQLIASFAWLPLHTP